MWEHFVVACRTSSLMAVLGVSSSDMKCLRYRIEAVRSMQVTATVRSGVQPSCVSGKPTVRPFDRLGSQRVQITSTHSCGGTTFRQ